MLLPLLTFIGERNLSQTTGTHNPILAMGMKNLIVLKKIFELRRQVRNDDLNVPTRYPAADK
jgi:hypothetical protein